MRGGEVKFDVCGLYAIDSPICLFADPSRYWERFGIRLHIP
jgi:hypothetical protein